MQKALVFTPDDTIETVDYEGYRTIQDVVDGSYDTCGHIDFGFEDKPSEATLHLTMFCNDEFLIRNDEKFDKVNAVASLLYGGELRGNVILTVDVETEDGIESRGFYYHEVSGKEAICEHAIAYDTFEKYIEENKDEIQALHEKLDMNKSEPEITYKTFKENEEIEF